MNSYICVEFINELDISHYNFNMKTITVFYFNSRVAKSNIKEKK